MENIGETGTDKAYGKYRSDRYRQSIWKLQERQVQTKHMKKTGETGTDNE